MSAPGALIILFNISVKLVAFTVVMRYPRPTSKNSHNKQPDIATRCIIAANDSRRNRNTHSAGNKRRRESRTALIGNRYIYIWSGTHRAVHSIQNLEMEAFCPRESGKQGVAFCHYEHSRAAIGVHRAYACTYLKTTLLKCNKE